jgi:hypothetical protein
MGRYIGLAALGLLFAACAACNTSGLANQPRATFSQLACLDINRDRLINDGDAADPSKLPDFNADSSRDGDDAAFVRGLSIPLHASFDYAQCAGRSKKMPEYLVAHGYFEPSDVSCDNDARPVLLVGVGGGAVNVRNKNDAAGVREVVDDLLDAYDERDEDAIAVIAAPAIGGAQLANAAMEDWLTHAVQVYFERYPCLRAVLVGHSLGAVSVDVAAARLESAYADRIIAVVDIDRIDADALYDGDIVSRPRSAPVFNIYETTDGLRGVPYEAPNAENWDASLEMAPGDDGVERPVTHTTIDNADGVHQRIVEEVISRT